jgi:predicted TIM-barrel fold metal-dependent hydrolase
MTTIQTDPLIDRKTGRVYHLISADSHINEPPDLWTSRLPAKFHARAPHVEHLAHGDGWVIEGVEGAMPFGLNACAGIESSKRNPWARFEEIRRGGWDPAARIEEIDLDGIDAEVMYPTPRLSSAIYATGDAEFHLALVQAYNDWIAEYCEHDVSRFRALPILPNRGVEQALLEIDRVGARPSTGGFLLGAYPGGTLVPRPEDDPVFAALVERSLAANIHVSLTLSMPGLVNTNAVPAGNRFLACPTQLADLAFSGLLERFPELQIVFAETDCGWVPYYKEQLDDGFIRYRSKYDLRFLPSEYIERQVHFVFVTDSYGIDNRHRVGVERILWSSDYPHGSANWPNTWPTVMASMAGVPIAERDMILAGNAARLYGFGR